LLGDVFFYQEECFCCLKGVAVVFDKFTEWLSVIFVFQEVKNGGEFSIVGRKSVSWGRSERRRGEIGRGHIESSAEVVCGLRIERESVSLIIVVS
jgi:hypothetical protein